MRGFRIVAVLLLLWNLLGIVAFAMQATADPAKLGDPVTARAFASMPTWAWLAYGVAVVSGTLGAIALLMRRSAATALFAASTLGMMVQFGWTFLVFRLLAYKSADAAVFPAVLIAVGMASAIYAYNRQRRGVLR